LNYYLNYQKKQELLAAMITDFAPTVGTADRRRSRDVHSGDRKKHLSQDFRFDWDNSTIVGASHLLAARETTFIWKVPESVCFRS
jgi:hypothetical protein